MKKSGQNKLKMFRNVLSVLMTWVEIWKDLKAFTQDVNKLQLTSESIDKKNASIKGSKAKSAEKAQAGQKMLDMALIVSGAGYSYASHIEDDSLKTKFDFKKTTLNNGNELDVCSRCIGISEAAEPIREHLLEFNIKAEQLDNLPVFTAAFNKLITGPRATIRTEKSYREEIDVLFAKGDKLLDENIDRQMLAFKPMNPDFYTEYSNARVIGGWSKGKKDDEDPGAPPAPAGDN